VNASIRLSTSASASLTGRSVDPARFCGAGLPAPAAAESRASEDPDHADDWRHASANVNAIVRRRSCVRPAVEPVQTCEGRVMSDPSQEPFALINVATRRSERVRRLDIDRGRSAAGEVQWLSRDRALRLPPEGGSHATSPVRLPPEGGSHATSPVRLPPEGGSHAAPTLVDAKHVRLRRT
jgi:hypothetical protein